jgi:hypothetical protein
MPDLYLPDAERHLLDDAPPAHDGGARAIWHITWDRNATAAAPADLVPFGNLVGYFTDGGRGAAPHLLWDPFTGRVAQFFAATSRSKSVVNLPGGVETNRQGDTCIQIESLFFPYCRVGGRVYPTLADTPCIGLDKIMAWLRSWGVPDVWPMGEPTWQANRNAAIWDTRSGHYGHSQVPENQHTDPGPMPLLFAAAPPAKPTPVPAPTKTTHPAPAYASYDGRPISNFTATERVRMWQGYMAWRGWPITVDGRYGAKSEAVCRTFQAECNAQGTPVGKVDGVIGPLTWAATKSKPLTK